MMYQFIMYIENYRCSMKNTFYTESWGLYKTTKERGGKCSQAKHMLVTLQVFNTQLLIFFTQTS